MAEPATSEPKVIALRKGPAETTETRVEVESTRSQRSTSPKVIPIRSAIAPTLTDEDVGKALHTNVAQKAWSRFGQKSGHPSPLPRELQGADSSGNTTAETAAARARKVRPIGRVSGATRSFSTSAGEKTQQTYQQQGAVGRYGMRRGARVGQRGFTRLTAKALRPVVNKLNTEIERGHDTAVFMFVLVIATFKDFALDFLLELTAIGEIPVVGWIPGMIISVFMMLFLYKKGWFKKTRGKMYRIVLLVVVWVIGGNVSIVKAIPIDTFVVIAAWRTVKKRAQKAEARLQEISKMREEEAKLLRQRMDQDPEYYEQYRDAAA